MISNKGQIQNQKTQMLSGSRVRIGIGIMMIGITFKNVCRLMEYIVHGSKNQIDSSFSLTLERFL